MSSQVTVAHVVTAADTAIAVGSGDVAMLATPTVIAWCEAATVAVATPHLEPGTTSVGIEVSLRHRRPSSVGDHVQITALLVENAGRRLVFDVSAFDDEELLAEGRIVRAVVRRDAFGMERSHP